MEQVKLITSHTVYDLEKKINKFMATLGRNTDIIDVDIDSEYADEPYVVLKDHLLATIRYATYTIEEPEPENYVPPDTTSNENPCVLDNINMPKQMDIKLFYPKTLLKDEDDTINDNNTDYGMELL